MIRLTGFLCCCIAVSASADDWPQWRGPQRDGVWREGGIIERFDSDVLQPIWRAPIGGGYSGPTVARGRVYVTDRLIEPTQVERVHCFDATSGKPIWTHTYDCPYRDVSYDAGPRASVLIDGNRAYSFGTMGDLYCLGAADGKVIWHRDGDAEFNVDMPIWGLASAPMIFEDLVIVQMGGSAGACLVALDKHSGVERWRALDDPAGYAAPILIEQGGQPVVVMWTGDHVNGVDPRTGRVHWRIEFKPKRMVIGISTPVLHGDHLFITSFFDGSLMLRIDPQRPTASEAWRRGGPNEKNTDALHSIISTPLLKKEHIYGVDSYGELRCLKISNGDRVWESLDAMPRARWGTIHFVEHGERSWLFNEQGELIIARLDESGYHEISRAKLLDPTTGQLPQRGGVCWSHPAFANRHVFARNDNELVCASLAATPSPAASVEAQRPALHAKFAKTLSNATFQGSWQMTRWEPGAEPLPLGQPKQDQYTISEVTPIGGDHWLVKARIQYADHDVTLPVPIKVLWAGDTAVITLDNMALPILGTYSARVLIHGSFYSGVWMGEGYGGVMSGQIKRKPADDGSPAGSTP
jgi:outer membrane protein assembly factor BamB